MTSLNSGLAASLNSDFAAKPEASSPAAAGDMTREAVAENPEEIRVPGTEKERNDAERNPGENRVPGTERDRGDAPAGNHATGTLKLIALFFMLIDHLGAVVFPQFSEMRILGRIAFPIYAWCMIVGFHYTRSVPKYLGRILLTGVLCQPLYAYTMNHMGQSGNLLRDLMLEKPNIFLTLFLGLAALWGIREKKYGSHLWAPAAALALATVFDVDYGWRGVFLLMLLYWARGTRGGVAATMIGFFLYWGTFYRITPLILGIPLDYNSWPAWLSQPVTAFTRLETYGLLSLPFILARYQKSIRMPAWLSYGIYPAHLLIVLLVKTLVKG